MSPAPAARRSPSPPHARAARPAVPAVPREFRPSLWAALDVPFKAFGALLGVLIPIYAGAFFHFEDPLATAGLLSFLGLAQILPPVLIAFMPAVRIIFTRYIVDEDGVRVVTQILSRTEKRVPWHKVTAIDHRRTLIDRMLGIERLDLIAYGARGTTLHLVGLRRAADLRDLAARRMREHATLGALLSSD